MEQKRIKMDYKWIYMDYKRIDWTQMDYKMITRNTFCDLFGRISFRWILMLR